MLLSDATPAPRAFADTRARDWSLIPESRRVEMAVVGIAAALVRIGLMVAFPIVFGGDSMVRLIHRDRILMSHQLPVLQLCLYLLNLLSPGLFLVRCLMVAVGVLAAEGFYLLAESFSDSRGAFLAALLFSTSPFITAVSIVPYQEIFMLAGLLFACFYFLKERFVAASIWLAFACFSRYEAWVMCPVMAAGYWIADFRFRRALRGAFLFGWAPAAWILWQHGLSPSGSFVLDHAITYRRLWRLLYIGAVTARETPVPVLLLAFAGIWLLKRRGHLHSTSVRLACLFTGLFAAALLFSAHGDPPDPDRYITSRDAHIPITILTLLSAIALAKYRRAGAILAIAGALWGVAGAWAYVRHETSRPEIRLGYEAAKYLDAHADPSNNILILAQPIPEASIRTYIDKARETGGEPGAEAAMRVLAATDMSPLDVQRFRVHTRRSSRHIFAYPRVPGEFDWIVVWSDFSPPDFRSAEWRRVAFARPEVVLRSQDKSVAISRVPSMP